ncbi:Transglutaminase-like protein [Gracilaria domingensis]|nr:Transglutaminase-like protein [Gracilaria domingensis]
MGDSFTLKVGPSSSSSQQSSVEVDVQVDETTLLDLRYQLFSLTDIAPERIYLRANGVVIHPNDDTDSTKTLSDAGISKETSLLYSDGPLQEAPKSETSQFVSLDDVRRALQRVKVQPSSAPIDPNTKRFLSRVKTYWESILEYEDPALQQKALKVVPVDHLTKLAEEAFRKKEYPSFRHAFFKQVLHWFKHTFYTWVDVPDCWSCGKKTALAGTEQPSPSETKFRASRTEVFSCASCGAESRFPRYNDAAKLLETRRGRCGEWAQAFTLIARSLGFRVRAVHDWTDHVWTEVYLPEDSTGRWVHADSCEDIMDEPLLYEKGWGKKLNYCIATGVDVVLDVTKRYTENYSQLKERRTLANERVLQQGLYSLHLESLGYKHGSERQDAEVRYARELEDLNVAHKNEGEADLPGRQSGSAAWVQSRGEDGSSK